MSADEGTPQLGEYVSAMFAAIDYVSRVGVARYAAGLTATLGTVEPPAVDLFG